MAIANNWTSVKQPFSHARAVPARFHPRLFNSRLAVFEPTKRRPMTTRMPNGCIPIAESTG